jgi:hypothetical protein
MHAAKISENPVEPAADEQLVICYQGESVGVKRARILIPRACKKLGLAGSTVVPRFAGDHAGSAADTSTVVH